MAKGAPGLHPVTPFAVDNPAQGDCLSEAKAGALHLMIPHRQPEHNPAMES